MPSIHSSREHVAARCAPSSPSARESPGRCWCSRRFPTSAAASSRRSISIATERARFPPPPPAAAAAHRPSAARRARRRRRRYRDRAGSAARCRGRSTLTATGCAPCGPLTSARCTCAIEAAATGGPNLMKSSVDRLAERFGDRRPRLPPAGRAPSRPASVSRSRAMRFADDVRPRRQELAELHVRRPELGERGRQPRRARAGVAPLEHARELEAEPRACAAARRIDQREDAFARQHEAGAGEARKMHDRGDHGVLRAASRNGARRCRRSSAWQSTRPKPALRIIAAKVSRSGKRRIDSTR